jgi:integrase
MSKETAIVRKTISDWEFGQKLTQAKSDKQLDDIIINLSGHIPWLHSKFSDNVWWVSADADTQSELDNIKLDFNGRLGDHGNLTDARFKKTLKAFKLLVLLTRLDIDDAFYIRQVGVGQKIFLGRLTQIFKVILDLGLASLSQATPLHTEQLREALVLGNIDQGSEKSIEDYIKKCISTGNVPTYQNSSKTLLSTKAIAEELNLMQRVLRDSKYVYHLDRLRRHFNLDLKDRDEFVDVLVESPRPKASTLMDYGRALSDLFYISQKADVDGFKHDPMGDYTVDGWASEFGKRGERTRNIPVPVAFGLLSDASDQLFTYGELAVDLQKLLVESASWGKEELPMIDTGVKEYVDKQRNRLIRDRAAEIASKHGIKKHHTTELETPTMQVVKDVVKHTVGACITILLGFTGRRDTELKRLKIDCLTEAKEGLLSFGETSKSDELISVYVAKTEQKYDTFPTNDLIVKAVNIMRQIAELSSPETGKTLLFQWYQVGVGHKTIGAFASLIQGFAELTGNDKDESGRTIKYACHQFRRFFAILFYWRYGAKDIYALSQYLGHFSLEMTKVYITEITGESMFNEEEKKWLAQRMASSWFKGAKVGGAVGKSINATGKAVIAKLKANMKMLRPNKVEQYLKTKLEEAAIDEVERQGLKVRFTSYGIVCFGASEGLRTKASCVPQNERSEYQMPRPENASFSMCASCAGGGCFEESKHLVEAKLDNAERLLEQNPNSIIGERARKDIEAAQAFLRGMSDV